MSQVVTLNAVQYTIPDTRVCPKCGVEKSRDGFYINKRHKNGLQSWCKTCCRDLNIRQRAKDPSKHRDANKRYRQANPEKRRDSILKSKYGIGVEEFARLLASQSGTCAICLRPPRKGTILHVDHDHRTGAVRGLLCNACNVAVGLLGDSVDRLTAAIEYLSRVGRMS